MTKPTLISPAGSDLFSCIVEPINSLESASEKGNYTDISDSVKKEDAFASLIEAKNSKRVYFVPVTQNVDMGCENIYLKKFGLTLCQQAPNYLMGAMAVLSEDEIPVELKGKDFVAAQKKEDAVFLPYEFLCVYRRDEGHRDLKFVFLGDCYGGAHGYVIIAEELVCG